MQCTYKRNVEARSRKDFYVEKSVSVKYSECVSVALVIQHAHRMRCIACLQSALNFFPNRILIHQGCSYIFELFHPFKGTIINLCCDFVLDSQEMNEYLDLSAFTCSLIPLLAIAKAVYFLLGNSPASEFYMPTFRNPLFHLHRQGGV
jgi:hypothetical protein